jgi:predicted dehydrogenase
MRSLVRPGVRFCAKDLGRMFRLFDPQTNNMETVHIGVIGAGGFGHFALQHFLQVPGVHLSAIASTHPAQADAMARRFGVPDVLTQEALLQRQDVNLIYIATPPFLHYDQAKAALEAGRHVICEKPLAVTPEQGHELVALAEARGLICVANLMQRYNPLYERVTRLVQSGLLGDFLHGYFENYASDEGLAAEHWFWDQGKSGGIFIEHGVHFFDMFDGWFGAGTVVAAQRSLRESGLEDQVQCTVRYPGGPLVNMYHGFTQPARLDRQEFRLLFERGDVTLEEWVPLRARIRAVVNEEQTRALLEIFPGAQLDVIKGYGGSDRAARGRHKTLDIAQHVHLLYGAGHNKGTRYGECLRGLMQDQVTWLRDRTHRRMIRESNGLNSLLMAAKATELARQSD